MLLPFSASAHNRRRGVLARLTQGLTQAIEQALAAETVAAAPGFLQGLDPRCKLVAALALIVSGLLTHSLLVLGGLFAGALALALASHISLWRLVWQVWSGVLLFTGAIALPAILLVPGETLWQLPFGDWHVTWQGLRSALFLIGRAETSATLLVLLMLTTPWPHLLKALRCLGVPVVLVVILGMTHRYIFVLLNSALQMFEARRSRLVAPLPPELQRKLVASALGVLLGKTLLLSSEVHLAMVARGYRGEVYLLDEFQTRRRDWLVCSVALAIPLLILGLQ